VLEYLHIILWFFLIEALSFISVPLIRSAGNRLADGGYSVARNLGIMLVTYLSWILSYLLGFSLTAVLIAFLLLCLVSIFLYRKQQFFPDRKILIINELVFASGFFFFLIVRMYLPNIYRHEKFMDFAFLNAVIRTTSFPPPDPWFAGGLMDFYYYFGYLSVAVFGKLSAVKPSILFNLAIALTFALSLNAFFGLGYNLTRGKIKYGILTAVFGILLGNIQGLIEFVSIYIQHEQVSGGYYWSSSRVIPFTINEFPYFSFIHGDLHSHMLAIPFQLLILSFILNIYLRKDENSIFENSLALLIFSMSLGFLFPFNTWDFPVYLGLTLLVIFAFYCGDYIHNRNLFAAVAKFSNSIIFISIFSLLPYLPFYLDFNPQAAGGLDFVLPESRTEIDKFLILFGLFLFLVFSFLVTRLDSRRKIIFFVLLAGVSALLSKAWVIPLLSILLPMFTLSMFLFLKDIPERSRSGFVYLLIATAAFLALLCEFIFLDDPISGEFARMNTVFKFYMHLWIFLAIAASYSYYELNFLYQNRSENRPILKRAVRKIWTAIVVVLIICCAIFPAVSTITRIEEMNADPSLDGMGYMKELDRGDYNAIRWMQKNINGSPVILEASEDNSSYSYACRVSANTGLPAVIGWARHEKFWGRDHEEVRKRIEDVSSIYSTDSEEEAIEIMEKYNVSYVYIGELERQIYDLRTEKFEDEAYFEPVYESSVTIYKLKKNP
jgi:YYY domain-containing protein